MRRVKNCVFATSGRHFSRIVALTTAEAKLHSERTASKFCRESYSSSCSLAGAATSMARRLMGFDKKSRAGHGFKLQGSRQPGSMKKSMMVSLSHCSSSDGFAHATLVLLDQSFHEPPRGQDLSPWRQKNNAFSTGQETSQLQTRRFQDSALVAEGKRPQRRKLLDEGSPL